MYSKKNNLQILRSIIISYTIFMMNKFVFVKKSFNFLLHYKTVFSDISSAVSKWMIMSFYKNISLTFMFSIRGVIMTFFRTKFSFNIKRISISPKLFTTLFTFFINSFSTDNSTTFSGTNDSFFVICKKYFFTFLTNKFIHISSIKKAVFSPLKKKQLLFQDLLAAIFRYRKTAFSLVTMIIALILNLSIISICSYAFAGDGSYIQFGAKSASSASDEAYGSSWDAITTIPPSKNAVYDKIQTISGVSPAGSNTEIQFNDNSSFGADTDLTWNKTTNVMTITGDITQQAVTANSVQASYGMTGSRELAPQSARFLSNIGIGPLVDTEDGTWRLRFNADYDNTVSYQFRLPSTYISNSTVYIGYTTITASTGAFQLNISCMAVTSGDTVTFNGDSFGVTNSSTVFNVPSTAGYLGEVNIPLSDTDDAQAGDGLIMRINRNPDDTDDTLTNDIAVRYIQIGW